MQKYQANAPSTARERFFTEVMVGLKRTDATKPLAEALQKQNDALRAMRLAREAAEEALIAPRVEARFAEFEFDQQVRALAHAAQVLDGGNRGPLFRALMPGGLQPLETCAGASQVAVGRKFVADLKATNLAAPTPCAWSGCRAWRVH